MMTKQSHVIIIYCTEFEDSVFLNEDTENCMSELGPSENPCTYIPYEEGGGQD